MVPCPGDHRGHLGSRGLRASRVSAAESPPRMAARKGGSKDNSSKQSCGIPARFPLLPTIHHSEFLKAKTTLSYGSLSQGAWPYMTGVSFTGPVRTENTAPYASVLRIARLPGTPDRLRPARSASPTGSGPQAPAPATPQVATHGVVVGSWPVRPVCPPSRTEPPGADRGGRRVRDRRSCRSLSSTLTAKSK